jgi:hypothetical protein
MAWAQQWAKEGVRVDWQKLLPPKGFQVLPRRLGCRENICVDLSQPQDEQRLRASSCDERGVYLRSYDSSDGETFSPCAIVFGQSQKEVG